MTKPTKISDQIDSGQLTRQLRQAFDALVAIDAPVYNHSSDGKNTFTLGAELRTGEDEYFANYYPEELYANCKEHLNDAGDIINAFGIREDVHIILKKYGCWAEWANPGQVSIYVE